MVRLASEGRVPQGGPRHEEADILSSIVPKLSARAADPAVTALRASAKA
ncbi:hypothetical protein [Streptomyces sp. NPDC054794]